MSEGADRTSVVPAVPTVLQLCRSILVVAYALPTEQIEVYNLLVRSDPTNSAWSKAQRFRLQQSRVFEYTEGRLSSMFREDIQRLKELPCLFSYEGFSGHGRVGRITSIRKLLVDVDVQFAIDERFPPIPIHDGETYDLFGCSGWECNRTHWAVKDGNLFEVVAELLARRVVRAGPEASAEAMVRIWGDQSRSRCRLFLSHRAKDKKATAKVAQQLRDRGHGTFVAHQDIQPTHEWRDEIVHALNTMTHFVALVGEGFHDGSWTDQEIGYAFARREVRRIFVKLSRADPKGLAGFEQAIAPGESSVAECIQHLVTEEN